MFELVHRRKRIAQVILGLLIIPFAFFGLEYYTRNTGQSDAVATVNGSPIGQREFGEELRRQQERLRQAFGPNVDTAALDTPETRRALLESLIAQRLVADAAVRAGLTVSDATLRETIAAVPAFQREGRFSRSTYETLLRAQGDTPQSFEARLRHNLLVAQLGEAVGGTALVSRTVAERLAVLLGERRELREALIPAKPYLAQAKVSEAQAKAYYEANPDEFRIPEQVRVEYVELSAQALAAQVQVPPEEVSASWQAQYGRNATERAAARKKIEALLGQLKGNPGSFAEVARKESSDRASAEEGGDLGFQARGELVKPFEDVLFRLKPGAMSGIVETEFGFHVIQLIESRRQGGREERRARHILVSAPPASPPIEQARKQIEAELRAQRAQRRFNEAAEAFANLVYEQSDSLKPATERFDLPLRTSGWISRTPNPEAGVLASPRILAALFTDDAIRAKRNTDAIEVSPGVLVSARVIEHKDASLRKYEDVRADIQRRLREEEAARLARQAGEEKLAVLRKGGDAGLDWGSPKAVSRRSAQGVPAGALRPLLAADAGRLPAFAGAARGTEGYMLYRVDKVLEPETRPEQQRNSERARALQLAGARQMDAFVDSLRAQAEVEIHAANFDKRP